MTAVMADLLQLLILIIQFLFSRSQTCSAPKNFSRQASCFNYWGGDEAVEVLVGLYVEAISAVVEGQMEFDLDLYLEQSWSDWHMEHNGTEPVSVSDPCLHSQFWLPDTYFANAKRAAFQTVTRPNKLLLVYPDGSLHYSTRILATLACNQNLRNYPMDHQTCRLRIQSYGHPNHQIYLKWFSEEPITYNEDISLPEMEVEEMVAGECVWNRTYGRTKFNKMQGSFSCLMAEIRFRRQIGYHLVQTYIPTSLIVMISWLSFWIDPTAVPARITLSFTTLLTLSTMAAGIRSSLPPVAYAKAIDYWVGLCTVFIVLALLEFAVINTILRHASMSSELRKSPSTSAVLPHSTDDDPAVSKPLLSQGEGGGESTKGREDLNVGELKEEMRRRRGKARRLRELAFGIDELSRYLFPFAFFLTNIAYWIVFSR